MMPHVILFILDVKSERERERERERENKTIASPLVIIMPMIWLLFYSYKW
jgi:hypothetical protein